MEDTLYRALQKRIDELPVPFPETDSGVELELLRALFTQEEASVALHLSAVAEPVETIQRRLAKRSATGNNIGGAGNGTTHRRETTSELTGLLESMAEKGAINAVTTRVGAERVRTYGLAPLVVGMFEFQVDKLTPEYIENFQSYLDQGFRSSIVGVSTGQLRTVPVRTGITAERKVAWYDNIRSYIADHRGPFSVINCVCRQSAEITGRACSTSSTHETCLMVGHVAPHGREISADEVIEILDRAEAEGHVLQPQNSREPAFICCCCKDCCEMLANARKLPRPADAIPSAHVARVHVDTCIACGLCLERCPMDAVALADGLPHESAAYAAGNQTGKSDGAARKAGARGWAMVDEDLCIGCGLCATACPVDAITLVRRRKVPRTPRNILFMYLRMYFDRWGVAGVLRVGLRKILGKKI